MMTMTTFSSLCAHDQDVCRLAMVARQRNVRVFHYQPTNEHYAVSRRGDALHRVTRLSCDCLGFQRAQRCTHHAALLDCLGELPAPIDSGSN
jgi:hypothetical protein